MKQSMSLNHTLKQEQELKLNLSNAQKLELVQSLTVHISTIRWKLWIESDKAIINVLKKIQESLTSPLNQVLELLFFWQNHELINLLLEKKYDLSENVDHWIDIVVLNYLYNSQGANWVFRTEDSDIEFNILKLDFEKAILDRKKIELEILDLEEQKVQYSYIKEKKDALIVADMLKEQYDYIQKFLKYILVYKVEWELLLLNFLKTSCILDKVDLLISERLLNRITSWFISRGINENTKSEKFHVLIMNNIGLYTMVILWIINPKIFTLQYFDNSPLKEALLETESNDWDTDLDEICRKFNMKNDNTIFFNRYFTLNEKPSTITNENIRNFVTKTVRTDTQEIMKHTRFNEFFSELKEKYLDLISEYKISKNDKRDYFYQKSYDLLYERDLEEILIKLINEKWYSELSIFYKK